MIASQNHSEEEEEEEYQSTPLPVITPPSTTSQTPLFPEPATSKQTPSVDVEKVASVFKPRFLYLVIILSIIVAAYVLILVIFLIYAAAVYDQSPFISSLRFLRRIPGKGDVRKLDLENIKYKELVEMVPEIGGLVRIMALRSNASTSEADDPLDVLIADNVTEIVEIRTFRGKHAFPFHGRYVHFTTCLTFRIPNGKYDFNGKSLQLGTNEQGFASNGLMYDKLMSISRMKQNLTAAFATMVYTTDPHTPGYPFQLEVRLRTALTAGGFSCEVFVSNKGSERAPFSYAWFPFFELDENPLDPLFLSIPGVVNLDLDSQELPTGNLSTVDYPDPSNIVIGEEEINLCLSLKDDPHAVKNSFGRYVTEVNYPSAATGIVLWQDTKFPFVRIKTTPSSILLSPMTSAPGSFANGNGLLTLGPGEYWSGRYGVYMK
jgi:aldose 1-epimerase